jgi:ABC-type bacteriocin/lantibiotic exporter with double-glycine peptidase domain
MLVVITSTYFLYTRSHSPMSEENVATVLFTLNVLFQHTYYLSHTVPGVISDLRNLNVHADFLRDLLSDGPEQEEHAQGRDGEGDAGARRKLGCVRLDRVDFYYDGIDVRLFRDLDMLLPCGVLIGLVGPSGSGKTTFVRMVLGQLRPRLGRVHLDGVDVRDLPGGTMAYIGQNTTRLFHRSVRYNVEYGHTRSRLVGVYAGHGGSLEAYVRELGLQDILPDLDADVGPLGEILSGGQRQTIHLLRCILNDRARIVILDEPTSSLDAAATEAVCRLMRRLAGDRARTVLVVTHDPAVEASCGAFVRFRKPAPATAAEGPGQMPPPAGHVNPSLSFLTV